MKSLQEQDAFVYKEIFLDNTYNVLPEEIKDKTIFDIGANKGFFALFCVKLGAKKIISVEPQLELFQDYLTQNVKNCSPVECVRAAVTDRAGDIVRLSNMDGGSSLYENLDKGLGQEVTTVTLADLLSKVPETETDMALKLDIEGSEYDVLMNVDKDLIRRFKTIYIEIHGVFHPKWRGTHVLEQRLAELGFHEANKLNMCEIYTATTGQQTYSPVDLCTSKYVRVDEPVKPYLVIAPFAQKLKTGKENPKNYPYWGELISLLQQEYTLVQIGVKGEKELVKDIRFNLPLRELKVLLKNSLGFVSVDSFLPHLARTIGVNGVVIWGPSDPNIFGYADNLNILKDRSNLRIKQFNIWEEETFNPLLYLEARPVFKEIRSFYQLKLEKQ